MASSKRKLEPAVVIVGEAKVRGGVDVRKRAPETITVQRGQEIHVKFVYRLEEANMEQETYRFEISSSLGATKTPPHVVTVDDTMVLQEDISGFVQNLYPAATGEQVLTYRAEADYRVKPWKGGVEKKANKVIEGKVRVIVET